MDTSTPLHDIEAIGPNDAGVALASSLLRTLGWGGQVRVLPSMHLDGRAIELCAAGESQAVLVLAGEDNGPNAVSLGYSRESPYTAIWTPERLRISRTTRWSYEPGDTALLEAPVADRRVMLDAIQALNRGAILDRALDQLEPAATEHPELARKLADELANLRAHVVESEVYAGEGAEATDLAVLRLFHRLLYTRVAEDRGRLKAPATIAQIAASDDPIAGTADMLQFCSRQFNSELFEAPAELLDRVPPGALASLLLALTEPWTHLRLDFSVAHTQLASRLYETYLGLVPAEEDAVATQQLFTTVAPLDRRSHQASYYTPSALADIIVDRALSAWVDVAQPARFSDVRVLDPACGSGTFLCAAFQWLRGYFERRFAQPLSSAQRAELLTTCIFGADLDERSLGLAQVQLLELAELDGRLPRLAGNLLHGDALGAPPGVEATSIGDVNWDNFLSQSGRPTCVVTNPPFISEAKRRRRLGRDRVARLDEIYPEVRSKGADHAYLFVSLAARLLDGRGCAGFVLPSQVLDGSSGEKTRSLLVDLGLHWLVDLRTVPVFAGVHVGVCAIATCVEDRRSAIHIGSARDYRTDPRRVIDALADDDGSHELLEFVEKHGTMRKRVAEGWSPLRIHRMRATHGDLAQASSTLSEHATVTQGVKPAGPTRVAPERIAQAQSGSVRIDDMTIPVRYAPLTVAGSNVTPFVARTTGERVLLPFEEDRTLTDNLAVLALVDRAGGMPTNYRYGNLAVLRGPKVLVRTMAYEPAAAADSEGTLIPLVRGAHALGFHDVAAKHLPGIAALLNSAIYQWLLRTVGTPRQNGFVELVDRDLQELPWPALSRDVLQLLTEHAGAAIGALELDDNTQSAARLRGARRRIDELAFELVGASTQLRDTVRSELLRSA
jgi:hypothetical protein